MDEIVKEIRQDVKELIKQGAVHNALLLEHERRSIALQTGLELQKTEIDSRLKPIEAHVSNVENVVKGILKVVGGALIVLIGQTLVRMLLLK
jgi:hypothetical protein